MADSNNDDVDNTSVTSRPDTASSVRIVDHADDLAKDIRPLGLSPAQGARYYGTSKEATFKPKLLSSPIRDAVTSSGYGITSPAKKDPSAAELPEGAYDDKRFSPFKSPFREIESEPRQPYQVETIPSAAKELRLLRDGEDMDPTFVPQLPTSTAAAREAATSSGYGRTSVQPKEPARETDSPFSPSMEKTKKSRKAVASSGYGKVSISPKKAERPLSADYTFQPNMSKSKDSQFYKQAASSGYGKVIPEKVEVQPEAPPFEPQIKIKTPYDGPSSGYGKVVPPPKDLSSPANENFTLDCIKFDNENKFPQRVPQHTVIADQDVHTELQPDEDGMF